eukprot:scaffold11383_cov70-Phaeocystis_antarctica.AAC.2
MLKVADLTPKKRRSAAATAPSSSGTTCPPLCQSIVIFSQREGTLKSCAALNSSSALPSTCNDGTVIDWGTSRSMLVGRRSHGMLQKLMKNWRDGERAATAAAMSPPSEMPQMPLIGEGCFSIQHSTCRTLLLNAAVRPASSSADNPGPLNASARSSASPASAASPHPKYLSRPYSPAAERLAKACGMGLTTCGASMNSSLTPCFWSSVSQPLSSSILRINELSPASPCSTRSTISAELDDSEGVCWIAEGRAESGSGRFSVSCSKMCAESAAGVGCAKIAVGASPHDGSRSFSRSMSCTTSTESRPSSMKPVCIAARASLAPLSGLRNAASPSAISAPSSAASPKQNSISTPCPSFAASSGRYPATSPRIRAPAFRWKRSPRSLPFSTCSAYDCSPSAVHSRQRHEGAQHIAQAACTRTRHQAQELRHRPARRVQRRLRPPHRLAQHFQGGHALRVHGGKQHAVAIEGDELSARLQLDSLPQCRLGRAQELRIPLRLQLEQLRQVRERREPEARTRRGHEALQRDARIRRALRVAQQVCVGQQARVRQRKLPVLHA